MTRRYCPCNALLAMPAGLLQSRVPSDEMLSYTCRYAAGLEGLRDNMFPAAFKVGTLRQGQGGGSAGGGAKRRRRYTLHFRACDVRATHPSRPAAPASLSPHSALPPASFAQRLLAPSISSPCPAPLAGPGPPAVRRVCLLRAGGPHSTHLQGGNKAAPRCLTESEGRLLLPGLAASWCLFGMRCESCRLPFLLGG